MSSDTQVRAGSRISTQRLYTKWPLLLRKDRRGCLLSFYRGRGLPEACTLAWRRDLLLFGSTPYAFRRLFASLPWAASIQEDAPSARNLRPASTVAPCALVRKNGSVLDLLSNEYIRNGHCSRTELVGDVSVSYFQKSH